MPNNWLLTERQKQIDTWLRAAVNFYGILPHRVFLVLFNRYNQPKLLKAELLKYGNKLMKQTDVTYIIYSNVIISNAVPRQVVQRTLYRQEGKKFYYPSQEELLKYVNRGYYESTEQVQKLSKYLRQDMKINVMAVEEFIGRVAWLNRIDDPIQSQTALFEQYNIVPKDIAAATELLDLMRDVSNNTRKWSNCGFTPQELFTEAMRNTGL